MGTFTEKEIANGRYETSDHDLIKNLAAMGAYPSDRKIGSDGKIVCIFSITENRDKLEEVLFGDLSSIMVSLASVRLANDFWISLVRHFSR